MIGPRAIEWKKAELEKGARQAGVDLPSRNDKESVSNWNFSVHFNGAMKRCFVEVSLVVTGKSDAATMTMSDVYDAFEGQHIGDLTYVKRDGDTRAMLVIAKVFDESVQESVYRALMQK